MDTETFYVVGESTGRVVVGTYKFKLKEYGRELVVANVTFK